MSHLCNLYILRLRSETLPERLCVSFRPYYLSNVKQGLSLSLSLSLSLTHTHTHTHTHNARAFVLEHDCVRSLYAVLRNPEKSMVARAFENTLSGNGGMATWRDARHGKKQ